MVLAVSARQHGVIAAAQLAALGVSARGVSYRMASGHLHPVARGVYAVGRPELSREGELIAALLACEGGALISHASAAWLWGLCDWPPLIHVSTERKVVRPGIRAHRRYVLGPRERDEHRRVPVTSPARTLADLSLVLRRGPLERAVNEADRLDVIHPPDLRAELDLLRGPGVARLRRILDERTFTLTDSELERRFFPIALEAGLPMPLTGERLHGYRVDFFWPALGLVVETDGLRYHRTPAEQARDRSRDQTHAAAGLTVLRFTHADVAHDPARVVRILRAVHRRLVTGPPSRVAQ